MKKLRYTWVFVVLLVMGLPLAVPAEDLPETAYDESETLPYEATPQISESMPQPTASAAEAMPAARRRQLATPSPQSVVMPINGADAHPFPQAQVTLALLCPLLC
jgi:hypothetical protein